MTTDRSYRKALPLEVALAELHENSGTQFAPDVVDALVAVVTDGAEPEWQLGIAPAPAPGPGSPTARPRTRRAAV